MALQMNNKQYVYIFLFLFLIPPTNAHKCLLQ